MLPDEPGGRDADIINVAREEFERRRMGTDATSYQHALARTSSPAARPKSILVPLSVVFDTAALGRHHIFTDSREWLVETVATVLRATDDPVIVRQHPSERRDRTSAAASTRARSWREAFGVEPTGPVRRREDPVNTYDLLEESRLVLPFVSTIGIEAAASESRWWWAVRCTTRTSGSSGRRRRSTSTPTCPGARRVWRAARATRPARPRLALLLPERGLPACMDRLHAPAGRLLALGRPRAPRAVRRARGRRPADGDRGRRAGPDPPPPAAARELSMRTRGTVHRVQADELQARPRAASPSRGGCRVCRPGSGHRPGR